MRTLKKTLCLVLALVMVMSLGVNAFAADAKTDYADYAKITEKHKEAVDVMTAVGVFNGISGNFEPATILTREQAAKILTYMLLGYDQAEKLTASEAPYSDVAASRWSAGSIAYCTNAGILAGMGDGTFQPQGQLTGLQFAKMLLCALGYNAEKEGLTGSSWQLNTAALAHNTTTGLVTNLGNVDLATAGMTRDQAAQMAFNAVNAPLVGYTTIGPGAVLVPGSNGAVYITSALASATRINARTLSTSGAFTVEFGEQYMPNLGLTRSNDDTRNGDAFGRPVHTWTYRTTDVGTYKDTDLLIASFADGKAVTNNDIYKLLGTSRLSGYSLVCYVDGAVAYNGTVRGAVNADIIAKNSNNWAGRGAVVEVYEDDDPNVRQVTVVTIYTYLAVKGVNDKFAVYGYGLNPQTIEEKDTDYEEDDIALVHVSSRFGTAEKPVEIIDIFDPEVKKEATLTSFSIAGTNNNKRYVVSDGTTYNYAWTAAYDPTVLNSYDNSNLRDITYTLYLDEWDNLIGIEEDKDPATYVFITGYDLPTTNFASTIATAKGIFTDGTVKTVTVDLKKSNLTWTNPAERLHNTWYEYTVSTTGTYILTAQTRQAQTKYVSGYTASTIPANSGKINASNPSVSAQAGFTGYNGTDKPTSVAYGNDDSIYITVKTADVNSHNHSVIDDVKSVSVGIQKTDIVVYNDTYASDKYDMNGVGTTTGTKYTANQFSSGIYALWDRNGYVIAAVVVGEEVTSGNEHLFYVAVQGNLRAKIAKEEYNAEDGMWYWTVEGILDGKEATIQVRGKDKGDFATQLNALYTAVQGDARIITLDKDGYVIKARAADDVSDVKAITGNGMYTIDEVDYLQMIGRTLYLTRTIGADVDGIPVIAKCPTTVVDNTGSKQKVTYYSDATDAIKALEVATNYGDQEYTLVITVDKNRTVINMVIAVDPVLGPTPTTNIVTINPIDVGYNGDLKIAADSNGKIPAFQVTVPSGHSIRVTASNCTATPKLIDYGTDKRVYEITVTNVTGNASIVIEDMAPDAPPAADEDDYDSDPGAGEEPDWVNNLYASLGISVARLPKSGLITIDVDTAKLSQAAEADIVKLAQGNGDGTKTTYAAVNGLYAFVGVQIGDTGKQLTNAMLGGKPFQGGTITGAEFYWDIGKFETSGLKLHESKDFVLTYDMDGAHYTWTIKLNVI